MRFCWSYTGFCVTFNYWVCITKVNLAVRIHIEYLFIQQYCFHNNIYKDKTAKWPTVPHSHQATFKDLSQNFINEYAFCTEFWTFETEFLWHSFLNFCISLEAATTNIPLHRTDDTRVIWCQVRAVQWNQDTPIKTAVTWLPYLRLCGGLVLLCRRTCRWFMILSWYTSTSCQWISAADVLVPRNIT